MLDSAADISKPATPAVSSARERMGILRRMSEIGLRMAERLDRQSEIAALHAESSAVPEAARPDCAHRLNEMTRSFAQVSRAVSVCVALEDRIERGPPIPQAQPFGPELVCPVPRESRLRTRRDQVQWAVRGAIDAYAPVAPSRVEDLCRRLDDLLDREVAAVDAFLTRPLDETIARLCERLGIEDPSPGRGRMGPVAEQREDGVTNADYLAPDLSRDVGVKSEKANTPSSQSPSATGAVPSPFRGRISDPSIPCRERKIACMSSRTVRAHGPP